MSGSSGSSHFVQETKPENDCRSLVIIRDLASPNPAAIGALTIGIELEVALRGETIIVTNGGTEVGSLIGDDTPALRRCLAFGNIYVAKVLNISGAAIRVQVSWVR